MKYNTKCKFFNEKYACDTLSSEGYDSCEECKFSQEYSKKILIIKLGAMGDVLRTTCILPALKQKYGEDILVYWMTNPESVDLLKNNNFIDKVLPYNPENLLRIQQEKFNILFSLEINTPATLLANLVDANEKFGYYFNNGSTSCFNQSAEEYLDTAFLHHKKLNNRKTYQQLISHTCELDLHYKKERPIFNLNEKHINFADQFKIENNLIGEKVIGINIGSADRWQSKFWNNEKIKELIRKLPRDYKIMILGGPNEVEKQEQLIIEMRGEGIFLLKNNPNNTLDEFAAVVNLCDKIICGDTMILHLASALSKEIIALFFANPPWEIEDYEFIKKIQSPLLEKYFYANEYIDELAESISIIQVLNALGFEK
jgi:ADP-heptose:LPS heptosyltransferase